VEVVRARADTLPNRMEFVSEVRSNFSVLVEPRVNGYLLSKHFRSGMPVQKGDLLFVIDPDLLSTTLLSAESSLESAKAQEVSARNNHERAIPLARINAISQTQLDQYTAEYIAAQAAVRSAKQQVRNARLQVGYTRIYAPIDGIIASSNANAGDYVGVGTQFTVLTTISNIDTVCVNVAIPMARYLRYAAHQPSLYENEGLLSHIRLSLAGGVAYPLEGRYSYTQKDITNKMGTLVLVVKFPNPDYMLKPGQFARVSANVGPEQRHILIPQQAVTQQQNIGQVWVVAPDSTVQCRQVTLGDTFASEWSITAGIDEGETVVCSGIQRLREGAKVTPIFN
jgi:membrane fusion protein (multidrug efflux system)